MPSQTNRKNAASQIGHLTQCMLEGSVQYLVGAYQVALLRHEVDAYANDPDFMPFVAILSEIDSLGFEITPDKWTEDFMRQHAVVINESTQWAKQISSYQCQSLLERYASA